METKQEMTPQYLKLPALVEYREQAARRRAAAFCDARESVLGAHVLPITPRTYSMLYTSRSAFLFGGDPTHDDVINFVWFHSPLFVYPDHPEWKMRKRKALRPLMLHMRQPWRRLLMLKADSNYANAALAIAITEIRKMFEDAFADAPAASQKASAPIATLEAHFVHEFSATYNWSVEHTRNTPLKRIFQLYRCIVRSRGGEICDRKEEAILANHLKRRNAELAAQRAEANKD